MDQVFSGAIGIHFGNTTASVAVWDQGTAKVLHCEDEGPTLPVCVEFKGNNCTVGERAKQQSYVGTPFVVYDLMYLLGRPFSDPEIQARRKRLWGFKVIEKDTQPRVKVTQPDTGKTDLYSPQQVAAKVISQLKKTAEAHLKKKVDKVVLSAPLSCDPAQRQAMKEAAEIAGFKVVEFIDEPVAAAITYVEGQKKSKDDKEDMGMEGMADEGEERVLVFRLGGKTCEATIVSLPSRRRHQQGPPSSPKVIASVGDSHLGGDNFSKVLYESSRDEVQQRQGLDVNRADGFTQGMFVSTAERAKINLSRLNEAVFAISAFVSPIHHSGAVPRARFEALSSVLRNRIGLLVDQVFQDAGLARDSMTRVILVGGSSRIPMIRAMLQRMFKNRPLENADTPKSFDPFERQDTTNKALHPDEVLAMGAAYQAYAIYGNSSGKEE
ncbi:hypothetical protein DFQ26_009766 [Actinomortierella ambigua]|nr:hypothetical protein DFQ26_009766 [Actinomortierella ambigua]